MRLIKITILWLFLAGWPMASSLAQNASGTEPAAAAAKTVKAEEGLPPAAPTIFHIGPFPVTNSMLVTWIVAILASSSFAQLPRAR
jgi:hypothetical protein